MKFFTFGSKDIGIDLGTANILMTLEGKGIVLKEPSVVAIDRKTGETVATGYEAKEMLGRTPEEIKAVRPMKDGVIADFSATGLMLKNMLKKVCSRYNAGKPRVVVGVPSGITEVAVISLGGIVVSNSLRIAGDELDEDIINYIKKEENLSIGETTAEQIKIQIGCATPLMTDMQMEIRGRDLSTGLPKNITIKSSAIMEAMRESISKIVETVKQTLEKTPPELSADLVEKGIYLAGGGALIQNLDKLLSQETKMPVYVANSPLECVAIGAGKTLEDLEKLKKVLINSRKRR